MNRALVSALLMLMSLLSAPAQSGGEIVQNPEAVKLRELWRLEGGLAGGDGVGAGAGSIGIGPDSLGGWAIFHTRKAQWQVFYGSKQPLATRITPDWTFDSASNRPGHPVVGDFWGEGRQAVGFPKYDRRDSNDIPRVYVQFSIFRKDAENRLLDTPTAVFPRDFPSFCLSDIQAADLDGDGDDELILARTCDYPQLLIYRGGHDFNLKAPSLIITENKLIGSGLDYLIALADIDGDQITDIASSGNYRLSGWSIGFYLSSQGFPWDEPPLHPAIPQLLGQIAPNSYLSLHDLNGDRIADFVGSTSQGDSAGVYIWLSQPTKPPLTRRYNRSDADIWLAGTEFTDWESSVGPLNDHSGRYGMLPVFQSTGGVAPLLLFSGGPNGPNQTWDAWYADGLQNVFSSTHAAALNDVNGDGWNDFITSNGQWPAMSVQVDC